MWGAGLNLFLVFGVCETACCTLHTAYCTLHIAHCILHTAYGTQHIAHCTLHIAHYTPHCTLHTLLLTMSCIRCTAIQHPAVHEHWAKMWRGANGHILYLLWGVSSVWCLLHFCNASTHIEEFPLPSAKDHLLPHLHCHSVSMSYFPRFSQLLYETYLLCINWGICSIVVLPIFKQF